MNYLEHQLNEERKIAEKAIAEIKKLEEQLQNAIAPKFKVGQTVWCIGQDDTVVSFVIDEIFINENRQGYHIIYKQDGFLGVMETFTYATREEAEKALAKRGAK